MFLEIHALLKNVHKMFLHASVLGKMARKYLQIKNPVLQLVYLYSLLGFSVLLLIPNSFFHSIIPKLTKKLYEAGKAISVVVMQRGDSYLLISTEFMIDKRSGISYYYYKNISS